VDQSLRGWATLAEPSPSARAEAASAALAAVVPRVLNFHSVERPSAPPDRAADAMYRIGGNVSMHALVVDDSRVMRRLLGDMLRQIGFEVSEAVNGHEAIEFLDGGNEPDVVLVDWNMPVMTGIDFVKIVREDERYQDLRLMMVTSETEAKQMQTALDAGANEYVTKPFVKEVIADKLRLLGF
jgi:two-component system chemotaxis response regulator CheY